jgi:NADH-quinone oxidoreductase subunit L
MPVSFGSWMVATAALCGVPLFAGFFSKDEIIDSAKHYDYTVLWVVSVVGAGMTAAYMTRATYLTWFGKPRGAAAHFMGTDDHAEHGDHADDDHAHGDHDDHGHDDEHATHGKPFPFAPHDSPWKITAPIMILAVLAVGSGYLNAPIFGIHWFEHQTESSIGLPIDHGDEYPADGDDHSDDESHDDEGAAGVSGFGGGGFVAAESSDSHHYEAPGAFKVPEPPTPTWPAIIWPGLVLVGAGFVVSTGLSLAVFGKRKNPLSWFVGWTERNRFIGAIHRFLVNKLQLDFLYENVIVRAIAYPISKAAYWINQHVIDGIVNAVGKGSKRSGELVYKYIDQGLVDGAVNASGTVASESGHALQPVQSGKVNQYGALLFGAAAVGAIVLILLNV